MVNVALWPDPGAVGSYNARVGTGVSQTNGLEEVLVTAINYITNVVTLTRGGGTSYSPGYALGFQAQGQWVRPFAAFSSGNGRGVADIGIFNTVVTKARVWDTTQDGGAHGSLHR